MADELYRLFFHATQDVFSLMLDLNHISEVLDGKKEDTGSSGKINISIGVVGDLQGEIIYHFPKETSLEMVKIMSGMDFPEVDDFVTSAIGEITNIISGKALMALSEKKVSCDILPPKIVIDGQVSEDSAPSSSSARICTDIGEIDLDVRLNRKQA
ncbi:chemotaxis protein CheX [Hydrogenispora ethanolica]|jgi:chemotaxis protein CheX|uniref:Chemotaxis protein CheX n=1 Tax=Hydrogenispora ethanolica TaxID=1082276 RepID=A0A4R1S4V8_HYDET|nr:chemotaxis protein CheX [Hydrogenispora ethanolica]TCL74268.1 chemotaxis protein CheX [Hydrogenispora ethanolica]